MEEESINTTHNLLIDLGLSTVDSVCEFYPKVRDRQDVSVLKCNHSGVIFLSSTQHMNGDYYEEKKDLHYWGVQTRQEAVNHDHEDSERRKRTIQSFVQNKKWLEVGAGNGAVLDKLAAFSNGVVVVEPQSGARACLQEAGYHVYPYLSDVPDHDFDVVTLFHVLEHLTDPLMTLQDIRARMSKDASIIIEVPHANDFLISFLAIEEFKAFTFWSEHLILHTRRSLETMLQRAGFNHIVVKGVQRYPLANHLYWLSKKRPGGHVHWPELRTQCLDTEYENMLISMDKTDTLIAIARRG